MKLHKGKGRAGAASVRDVKLLVLSLFLTLPLTGRAAERVVWKDYQKGYWSISPSNFRPVKATPRQMSLYERRMNAKPPLVSPNGRYRILSPASIHTFAGNGEYDQVALMRLPGRTSVFKISQLPFGPHSQNLVYKWLPGDLITFSYNDHISSSEEYYRLTIDLATKQKTYFNGWLSPRRTVAIVPATEKVAEGYEAHVAGDNLYREDQMAFYLVRPPQDLRRYRFRQASPKLIRFDGKGKAGVSLLIADADFSKDGRWAVLGSYLIDLRSARAKKMPGESYLSRYFISTP